MAQSRIRKIYGKIYERGIKIFPPKFFLFFRAHKNFCGLEKGKNAPKGRFYVKLSMFESTGIKKALLVRSWFLGMNLVGAEVLALGLAIIIPLPRRTYPGGFLQQGLSPF